MRREQIKLQVTLINPLISVKGYAASATTAAVERAQLLIEQAEALGEPPGDPLLLFSVLYGVWAANYVALNGDVMHRLAAHFLSLAEKQKATFPLMTGHRLIGISLVVTGRDVAKGRSHLDRAVALCDPVEHRPSATRFGNTDTSRWGGGVQLGFDDMLPSRVVIGVAADMSSGGNKTTTLSDASGISANQTTVFDKFAGGWGMRPITS